MYMIFKIHLKNPNNWITSDGPKYPRLSLCNNCETEQLDNTSF